ncbi:MAG: NAD(P)-dependent oxidoreductase [Armatimonadetes bacterium]|nr:NAD(P)-dependent oxidoreductase [Armatimonadota bacterium]
MRIAVIGGTGHIGRFLCGMLLKNGHEVVIIHSGRTSVCDPVIAEKSLVVTLRYQDMLADGTFASLLADQHIEVVIDILQGDIQRVYADCLSTKVEHLIACGSVWMYGRPKVVPTPEVAQTECLFEGYRQRYAELLATIEVARQDGIPVTAIMPPNICGPGKVPLECSGGRSIEVHKAHRRGEPVILPFPGTNLIGPCDAEDVAQGFLCAVENRRAAAFEIFNVGSAYALTAEKFVKTYEEIYKTTIPIEYVSPEIYAREISPNISANFHFLEHMCPDISKISSRLGYEPLYTPEETMERAVKWMNDEGFFD